MPDASIIIVTRNRKEKAKVAVESALSQVGDHEVIVFDDGSTDGTTDFLRANFPQVPVHRTEDQRGLVVQRNLAADVATGMVLINLDDDAVFTDEQAVVDSLKMFSDPRIGAATIPHINVSSDGKQKVLFGYEAPDDGKAHLVSVFAGGASAIRRDVFLQVGGLQGYLFHWGEETEFSQRMIGFGYVIRCGPKARILHYPEGKGKYTRKTNRYIFRNRLLTIWLNAPSLYVLPLMTLQSGKALKSAMTGKEDFLSVLEGLSMGWASIFTAWNLRRGVSRKLYHLWLFIRKHPLVPLDEVASSLPVVIK